MVDPANVNSQTGLLQFLAVCVALASRARYRCAPLLVDVNIHYRLLKLACAASTVAWDIPAYLRCVPPLFAIWHAYKCCVEMVTRLFHTLVWFVVHGRCRSATW